MKKWILFSLLGALSVAANAQAVPQAQAAPDTSSVRIPASPELAIRLPARAHTMFKGDFDEFKGAYELANGKVLSLYARGRHMFADVDGEGTTEIIAAASNVFVALNEKMKITIVHDWSGEVGGELLWIPPSQLAEQGSSGGAGRVMSLAIR